MCNLDVAAAASNSGKVISSIVLEAACTCENTGTLRTIGAAKSLRQNAMGLCEYRMYLGSGKARARKNDTCKVNQPQLHHPLAQVVLRSVHPCAFFPCSVPGQS